MALGEIYKLNKNPSAVNCFKEVLKESPFALKAILNLIKMDVKVSDITAIVSPAIASIPSMNWLNSWIRAQSYMNSAQISTAITLLRQLYENSQFKDNVEIMISLGEALYYNGDYKKAIPLFRRAYATDSINLRGLDFYAAALTKENQLKELENLANQMIPRCETCESAPEPWIVLSYYCYLSKTEKKEQKAIFFAQKVTQFNYILHVLLTFF
jgi:anaphase-promoting complex subunit 7